MNNENNLIFERYQKSRDQIKGGKADNKTCEDIAKRHGVSLEQIKKQVSKGTKIEMEHTDDKTKALEIVHDHLWEFSDYYTGLTKMEKDLKNEQSK